MLHVTSNIFPTFFHPQEGRSAIHDAVLPTFSGAPSIPTHWPSLHHSLSRLGESFPVLWLHLHYFSCCLMLDSTHLERKDWGKTGLLFPITCLQLMTLTRSHLCKLTEIKVSQKSGWCWRVSLALSIKDSVDNRH